MAIAEHTLRRLFRYGVVGVLGAVLYLGTTTFLVGVLKWDPVISSVIGFLLSVVEGYTLNYFWTFQCETSHMEAASRFLVVSCSGLALNISLMYLGVTVLGMHYLIVALTVMALVPVSNYLMNAHWTFRRPPLERALSRQSG